MERTLEEQHRIERDYYMGKTDKIAGKKVSALKEEYETHKEKYDKKLDKLRASHTYAPKSDVKVQPVSTVVTFQTIDKVKVDTPEAEKAVETVPNSKTVATEPKSEAVEETKKP